MRDKGLWLRGHLGRGAESQRLGERKRDAKENTQIIDRGGLLANLGTGFADRIQIAVHHILRCTTEVYAVGCDDEVLHFVGASYRRFGRKLLTMLLELSQGAALRNKDKLVIREADLDADDVVHSGLHQGSVPRDIWTMASLLHQNSHTRSYTLAHTYRNPQKEVADPRLHPASRAGAAVT